jgi:hypothetical protein
MVYFVALASAFLVLSAATALRPGRRGLSAILAYPVGWAAGELPVQGIIAELVLLGLLAWSGWPKTTWLDLLVIVLGAVVVAENLALIAIAFYARRIVRRSMAQAPKAPLRISHTGDDAFGSWWRTAMQFPFHPRDMHLVKNVAYGPLPRQRLDVWRMSTTPLHAPVVLYIHGGSWMMGDKREQGRPMLHEFVRRGWIAVVPNYRLAPRHLRRRPGARRHRRWLGRGTARGARGAVRDGPDVAARGHARRHRLVRARGDAVLRRLGDDRR